ncbi:GDSL-type esterase/lipase family protein [Pontiella sp.]|uniref:GDSL-type esterase/lipase family protein n=1 Tax=Pontiella sp. TaxID=2837462 RepID=UPI0035664158
MKWMKLVAVLCLALTCRAEEGKDLGAIWFVGDSITQSNADGDPQGSPRKALYDLLTAHGYQFSYTGHHVRNVDGLPETGATPAENRYHYHSGISGSVIDEPIRRRVGMTQSMSTFWTSGRLAEVKPDIILIMLGTNDMGERFDLPNAPKRLSALVQTIYDLPDVGNPKIFLATIPPSRRNEAETASVIEFNQAIPAIVETFRAQGKAIYFVDQFTPLNEAYETSMRPDNLHPNAAGNTTMAEQWYQAIVSVCGAKEGTGFSGNKTDFRGFDRFEIPTAEGRISVVCPKQAAPGKPWLWRSIFWGMKGSAVERFTRADLQLLEQGFHVVVAPGDVSGHPRGNKKIDAAYELLTETYGFSKTVSMASMSRETLALFRWASANPEKVESIYVDNGVCNLNSWPGGKLVPGSGSKGSGSKKSWALLKETYGFATDEEALAATVSPIDLLEPLAKAGVPILMGCGTRDRTVPYEENGAILKERYEELGGAIEVVFEDKDHHPHGLADPAPVVEFVKSNRLRKAGL